MDHEQASPPAAPVAALAQKKKPLKAVWRRIRKPLAQSRFVKGSLATLMAQWLRLIRLTSPLAPGCGSVAEADRLYRPTIFAMWHGQHLMATPVWPKGAPLVAMVSKSDDAELNALVIEKFDIRTVRGSGGRQDTRHVDKGGARALIALKKALDAGSNVFMIADIPHGTPRQAGLGVITLARISGRPIVPVAIVTSRRKVLERSWDKTTINLPFGRLGVIVGDPVAVPADADETGMEARRVELTDGLNDANRRAYQIVDGAR